MYNKSNIMRNAWNIKKTAGVSWKLYSSILKGGE